MRNPKSDATEPLDPIAFTLAVWLGLIVSVTGLVRLSERAADQAASHPRTIAVDDAVNDSSRLMAFGG